MGPKDGVIGTGVHTGEIFRSEVDGAAGFPALPASNRVGSLSVNGIHSVDQEQTILMTLASKLLNFTSVNAPRNAHAT